MINYSIVNQTTITGLIAIILMVLPSCASLNSSYQQNFIHLTAANLELLNGTYRNVSLAASSPSRYTDRYPLWEALKRRSVNDTSLLDSNLTVQLEVHNRKVIVKLFKDTLCKAKMKLNGTTRDGYYNVRRKVVYRGVPFFMWYTTAKIRLGLNDTKNLLVDGCLSQYAWIFLFSDGSQNHYSLIFARTEVSSK